MKLPLILFPRWPSWNCGSAPQMALHYVGGTLCSPWLHSRWSHPFCPTQQRGSDMQTTTIRSSCPADLCQLPSELFRARGDVYRAFQFKSRSKIFILYSHQFGLLKLVYMLACISWSPDWALWSRSRTFCQAVSNCDKLVREASCLLWGDICRQAETRISG